MKRKEIIVGGVYSNGWSRTRRVVEILPNHKPYDWDWCKPQTCVKYEVVDDGTKRNVTGGQCSVMTLAAFVSWAKERVE